MTNNVFGGTLSLTQPNDIGSFSYIMELQTHTVRTCGCSGVELESTGIKREAMSSVGSLTCS